MTDPSIQTVRPHEATGTPRPARPTLRRVITGSGETTVGDRRKPSTGLDWLTGRGVIRSPEEELLKANDDTFRLLTRADLMSTPDLTRIQDSLRILERQGTQGDLAIRIAMATRLRREVLHLLDRYPSSRQTKELYRQGSRLSLMLARFSAEAGQPCLGGFQYALARLLATRAGDKPPAVPVGVTTLRST